ncbi:MAG: hypothetical protein Q9166_002548 [cf. Caloplaca sp. 2 TL-2023]
MKEVADNVCGHGDLGMVIVAFKIFFPFATDISPLLLLRAPSICDQASIIYLGFLQTVDVASDMADIRALLPQGITRSNVIPLMASSEVDQKFLGRFAKQTNIHKPYLSSFLYKVLGLSVILSKKLLRARRLRKLDTTRDTKSLQLYHHIIWLSREGLIMIEQYIIPMVADQVELKVLAYKLRASFYHIFVLFHNQPSVHQTAIPSFSSADKGKAVDRFSIRSSPNPLEGGPVQPLPPGLSPVSIPKPSAAFLLPATDYIPTATHCFTEASALADALLSGSHPVRLSVKIEFAAYLYDCLHDGDQSRTLAGRAIRDVYHATEGMNEEDFEDAAEQVQILGKMKKRGISASVGSSTPRLGGGDGSTPRAESSTSTPRTTRTMKTDVLPEASANGTNGVGRASRKSPQRSR